MNARRFHITTAAPLRALVESWLLEMALLTGLASLGPLLSSFVIGNATLLISGLCGLWCALRLRWSNATVPWNLIETAALGAACSLLLTAGLGLGTVALGWGGPLAHGARVAK